MESVYVNCEVEDHIATLTLSNPPRHTINAAGSEELLLRLEQLHDDPSIRVVILTGGSEDIFVRHYEVAELARASERLTSAQSSEVRADQPARTPGQRRERGLRGAMAFLEQMNAVTIAAVNGMAMGGGLELALACDFRLAREGDFSIGLPETSVAILPGGGGTQRLARLIGVAKALDLILHGAICHPQQALELGIVSRVLPHELSQYRDAVSAFAMRLAARAPRALANSKRAIREGIELPLSEGLRREAQLFGELMRTEDAASALRATAQGDGPPPFKGR